MTELYRQSTKMTLTKIYLVSIWQKNKNIKVRQVCLWSANNLTKTLWKMCSIINIILEKMHLIRSVLVTMKCMTKMMLRIPFFKFHHRIKVGKIKNFPLINILNLVKKLFKEKYKSYKWNSSWPNKKYNLGNTKITHKNKTK